MGAMAQSLAVVWDPEDDFLLKKAVEDGASLEALAKGAIQFSHRFSFQEVKDRWISILYDPVISSEVSARLIEIERSPSNHPQKSFGLRGSKDKKSNATKRKIDSIHNCYYATRKKIRSDYLRSVEMELADGQIYASYHNNQIELPLHDMLENPALCQQFDAGFMHHSCPQVTMDGVANSCNRFTSQPFHAGHQQLVSDIFPDEQGILPDENPQLIGEASLTGDCFQVNMSDNIGLPEEPNMMFDQTNDDGDVLDGLGGDTFYPDCGVSLDSFKLLWEPNEDTLMGTMLLDDNPADKNDCAGDILVVPEGGQSFDTGMLCHDAGLPESHCATQNQDGDLRTSDSDEYLTELRELLDCDFTFMDTDGRPSSDNPLDDGLNSQTYADQYRSTMKAEPFGVCASNPADGHHLEAHDQQPCLLNMEYPDYPNNDDAIFTPSLSSTVKEGHEINGGASNLLDMDKINLQNHQVTFKGQISGTTHEKGCHHSASGYEIPNNLHKAEVNASLKSSSPLPDNVKGECTELDMTSKHQQPVIAKALDQCSGSAASPFETNGNCIQQDSLHGKIPGERPLPGRMSCNDLSAQETVAPPSISEIEKHIEESDDEMPCFSDIETMILEMDLDPEDHDIDVREVSKYQSKDTKKEILRLEQAAHSYMQRAIARKGALAVIYGRRIKHYVRKSEVLIGRGTDDFHVDIDLSIGGRAKKVSRRQATIKLEADGTFHIKNLGKCSIYKNCQEVATGRSVRVQSGNLIEIRKMSFIFEENPTCVKHYLQRLPSILKQQIPQNPPE